MSLGTAAGKFFSLGRDGAKYLKHGFSFIKKYVSAKYLAISRC